MAKMLRDGIGCASNAEESARCFQVAFSGFQSMEAERGDDSLQYRLGQMLRDGVGTEPDATRSREYFEASAKQGNQFAQYALGKLFLLGQDVPQDRELAVYWLTLSAEQGNEYAQWFLDHMDEFRSPSLLASATWLLRSLGKLFEDQGQKLTTRADHIDRKRARELHQKLQAQGHAKDEQIQHQRY
jgi:TPR repeat protein